MATQKLMQVSSRQFCLHKQPTRSCGPVSIGVHFLPQKIFKILMGSKVTVNTARVYARGICKEVFWGGGDTGVLMYGLNCKSAPVSKHGSTSHVFQDAEFCFRLAVNRSSCN